MVSLHTAPHLHVCRSVTRARAKWSVNALQCCEAIYRGLGVVAENVLWPAGTRGARKRSRKKNDWGWRDAASRYPQSLPRHVFFRAPHVPAGRESFLKTAPNPRYNAPRHYNAFADHFARARVTDRQTSRHGAVCNETIQILGAERCRTRAFVAERKMLAGWMSRAAHVVGNSGEGSQVYGRAGQWHQDQLQLIGVDKRRVQREMIWGRPLMPYVLLWRKPQVQ